MPTSESHNAITRIAHHDVFEQQIVVILTIHLLDFTIIINRNNNAGGTVRKWMGRDWEENVDK